MKHLATSKSKRKAPPRRKREEYTEDPDWGTAFQRTDNSPPQPGFTGTGVISAETLEAIQNAGGQFQVSVWTLNRDGKPLRNRDGSRRFRLHIEAPWESDEDDDDEDDDEDDDNNVPF